MKLIRTIALLTLLSSALVASAQTRKPSLTYTASFPAAQNHIAHIELRASSWNTDSLHFKMPKWMPGYYQLLNYANALDNVSARDAQGKNIPLKKKSGNTWSIGGIRNKSFFLSYDVKAEKQFVAQSFVDSTRAYLVCASMFMYPDGFLNTPVSIKVIPAKGWTQTATGLDLLPGKRNEYTAPDFDILYDCPILIGNLEELPAFHVGGINHRFIGYRLGAFDRINFMNNLKKVVEAGAAVIGDIPYKEYTFIAIGPGRGGIEHLNNTTFGFDGNGLDAPAAMNRMLNFLAHEYFHHYNVKRIRPFELGPFDYDQGTRTNLLWVSEGISVYYEYMIVKRAGLIEERTFFSDFENNINATERNPGKAFQSLAQASYATWSEGPFGTAGTEPGKSISYYDKGPVVGLLLDLAIRQATHSAKSLDDVMRLLYWDYYKGRQRGITDAEFQQACETVAGTSLAKVFEFVYTTKDLDYATYLGFAGLVLEQQPPSEANTGKKSGPTFLIRKMESMSADQTQLLKAWLGEG